MSFPRARYWYVLLCAGCAQLAGFEDFNGPTGPGGEGGTRITTGGVTSPTTGGSSQANGGRASGGNSGRPGAGGTSDGGEPVSPDAGDAGFADAGEGGATGSGGSPSGGSPSNGGVTDTGGTANGGIPNGGIPNGGSTTGGAPSGGTASGGSATGGSATGGKASDPCGQLLVNPAFANGSDGWTETSSYPDFANNLHPIITAGSDPELTAQGVAPESDDYLLWLGGVPDSNKGHRVMASQVVTLSPKLEELQFSVAARIETAESMNMMFDNVYIELRAMDADESLVWQFIDRDNRDATDGWVDLDPSIPDHSDIERIRGQTVTFMAYSRTDRENTTHFWLDSMSLRGLCNP